MCLLTVASSSPNQEGHDLLKKKVSMSIISSSQTNTSESVDAMALLADQRRARRRLMRWRFVAILAAVLAVLIAFQDQFVEATGPYVARVEINSVIVEDQDRSILLQDLVSDPDVEAVILALNSPGGTTYGGEQLLKELDKIRAEKPVVAVMGTMATSAAYMAALGADHILAGETTLTGSIGVILQSAQITGLLEKIGIEATVIKSGDNKAVPNPFEPLTAEGRDQVQATIDETFNWFLNLVMKRRDLSSGSIETVSDGRVMTGRMALETGLVDDIGAEAEAVKWLQTEHGLSVDADIYTVWPIPSPPSFTEELVGELFGKSQISEALMLDGLVALWHPGTR